MNSLNITGNLTRDPELRQTRDGISVVSGTIAVQRAFKGRDGEKSADFIDFVAWDKKAEYLSTFAKKGDRLEISGRLESRKYTDRNNQERIVWECIVENVTSFSKKSEEKPQESNSAEAIEIADEDLPF